MSEKFPQVIYLPETMANWPWRRAINPHYEEVKAASNAWFESFKPFTPQSQIAFNKCDFEHLRTGCDLMNLFFVVDEYTDVEPEPVVRAMVDIVIDALNNPHKPRPDGEILLGVVAQQFWQLAAKTASPTSQRHMIESFTAYLESVVQQAADRDSDTFRSIDSYFQNRRQNIGARPSYVPMELDLHLPDEVFYHPVIEELSYYIADLIILDNDIASYNKEQATGDDRHNVITIAMHEFNVDLDGAMQWAANYHVEVETKFLDGLKRVPSWGPEIDQQLKQYIYGLANWPRCNDCWNFESGRYFGSKGREIQKTRLVPLLPKSVCRDNSLRRENVVVPLVDALSKL
ncbi:terpenoid synthase [Flammula alnicola]|nr:terpenoid synthase [Flammula alnicola]